MKKLATLLFAVLVMLSCIEKEKPKPMPHIPGDVTRQEIFIDADYKYQVFYNLETNLAISKNLKTDWDFSIDTENGTLQLNSAKFMQAAKTKASDLATVNSKAGLTFVPDHPSGFTQDLSIGNWEENVVYVLDRGYNSDGNLLGYAKIKLFRKEEKVFLEYAPLAQTEFKTLEITKNQGFDAMYISIENGEVSIAPPTNQWHLCFTQYTHIYEDEVPYLVTGVLINTKNTLAQEFSDSSFAAIKLAQAQNLAYSDSASIIGFDWKMYSFETSSFTTDTKRNFVVQTDNKYYKLHFLDFYTEDGLKGNFYFEYQKL